MEIAGGRTEHQELYEELARKVEQQAAVAELGRRALTGATVPELREQAVQATSAALGTELVSILLLDDDGETLSCRASVGWRPEMIRPVPLVETSQLGFTFLSEDPVIVPDLADDARFETSRHLLEHGIVSAAAVPIRSSTRPVGVLATHARERRSFNEDDILFLRGVANVLAAAIANERAQARERDALDRAERLQRVTARLADALTVEHVVEITLGEGIDAAGAPAGLVALLEPDGETIRVVAARGYADTTLVGWWTFALGDTLPVSEAVRSREGVFCATGEERNRRFPAMAVLDQPSHALVALPLVAHGEGLGALVLSFAGERRFAEADQQFLQALANQCAQALERARLFLEQERRAEAARALAFVADGVVLVDRDGVVRLWNDAAAQMTGVGAAEVVGRRALEAIPGWAAFAPRVRSAAAGAQLPRPLTLPLDLPGGELWLSTTAVDFAEGTVYAFRDVTEEQALERLKSDFIATVSHELRTPLAAVYGAAATLRNRGGLDPEERTRFLEMIEEQSERLSRIVNEILIASRLEAGHLPVALDAVAPAELAQQVVEVARRAAPEGFAIELELAEGLPRTLADPDRLRQVLANLLDNAVKYSGGSGGARLQVREHDGCVRFVVRDRGIGIPAGDRDRIFDKFYRVDATMSGGVSGTGLGLYIVRELVSRMGGRIHVESEVGVGSSFVVELPAAR